MLNRTTHNSQAEHNEKLVAYLAGTDFTDWQATCMFYAALHYISAYFSHRELQECKTHSERDPAVKQHLNKIYRDYRNLKDWSVSARYKCKKPDLSNLAGIYESLDKIKKEIRNLGSA